MWRGRFINIVNYNKILRQKRGSSIQIRRKDQTIVAAMIGRGYFVHNGKKFIKKSVTMDDLGYRLGDFIYTRIKHIYKKKKKKKKKK